MQMVLSNVKNRILTSIKASYDNGIDFSWCPQETAKNYLRDIFRMDRDVLEYDVYSRLHMIWDHIDIFKDGAWVIALMFYIRNIREFSYTIDNSTNPSNEITVPSGRGEKVLSYHIALWVLENHEKMFVCNHTTFVKTIGCYKDCLNMARLAKDKKMSDKNINLILMPMAMALVEDENNIVWNFMNKDKPRRKISLASKWAPREGKSFSEFIPYLKKLCNITGKQSNKKWRKYIQQLVLSCPTSIETLLSTKQYDKINFTSIPSKAFALYRNAFMRTDGISTNYKVFLETNRYIKSLEWELSQDNNTDIYQSTNKHKCIEIVSHFIPLVYVE